MRGAGMQDFLGQERLYKEKKQKKHGRVQHSIWVLTKEVSPDKIYIRSDRVLHILLSINPSIAFLWAVVSEAIYYVRSSELDRTFATIIREVEEEMEEDVEEDSMGINVAFVDDKAYWVLDNTFYQADIIDGEIDRESSRPIDTSSMSYRDMGKMLFILDHLKEG